MIKKITHDHQLYFSIMLKALKLLSAVVILAHLSFGVNTSVTKLL